MRAWSTPFFRPMAPFLIGGAITFYLVNNAQESMLKGDAYKNDVRNPYFTSEKEEKH
ncbi:hypothetical protein BGZ50_004648 [Haplosporangium sp. Z 11]|nr:hypothetical protein BGZ50_004648 [Haplosporangium sp. Z 11]